MPSFDVVSEVDWHEVSNAVDQANREVVNRFDFKGSGAKFELHDKVLKLVAEADFQLKQMSDILVIKFTKRQISLGFCTWADPVIHHKQASQQVTFQDGLSKEVAKDLVKRIKAEKFKVTTAVMGEQIRVTGKKRDDLQAVMEFLRQAELETPLSFNNFRD